MERGPNLLGYVVAGVLLLILMLNLPASLLGPRIWRLGRALQQLERLPSGCRDRGNEAGDRVQPAGDRRLPRLARLPLTGR